MYAARTSGTGARAVGVSVTACVLAVVGYAAVAGIGARFTPPVAAPLVIEFIDAPDATVPDPLPVIEIPATIDTAPPPPPVFVPPVFFPEETPPIIAAPETPVVAGPTGPPTSPRGSDRIAPKIRAGEKPPYPAMSRRLQEQGVTGLEVCVNANGRVTSARLNRSSGHARLDEAALKWVREARFTPGSAGGKAQPMCGHGVDYEWTLED